MAALPQDRHHHHLCRGGGVERGGGLAPRPPSPPPLSWRRSDAPPTVFGHAARARTQGLKFFGKGCPGFVDGRRENAEPPAFWPSTARGRVRTVAATCQDRHLDGGGGLAGRTVEPRRPRRPLRWDPGSARPK